jgi:hypothetical protein
VRGLRLLPTLLLIGLLAGCGGSGKPQAAATTTARHAAVPGPVAAMQALVRRDPALGGKLTMLFESSAWSVVQSITASGASAVPFHLVRGRWLPDRVKGVTIEILGPDPGDRDAPVLPQVAMEITAHKPFVESALWVDGSLLNVQGGGTATNGTIYGAPVGRLRAGRHVAVGYARTATVAAAVAWTFQVP